MEISRNEFFTGGMSGAPGAFGVRRIFSSGSMVGGTPKSRSGGRATVAARLIFALGLVACSASFARPTFYAPDRIYAVPGVECNVYYARLLDSYTPNRYLLEAVCGKGAAYSTCWSYVAKDDEAGTEFPLVLNAWDDECGLVASMTTRVCVAKAPSEAAKNRRITLALLSASSTNCRYQDRVLERMRNAGWSGYTPVGSRSGYSAEKDGTKKDGEAPHDGYGGFSWGDFMTRYSLTVEEIDNVQSESEREQLMRFGVKIPPGKEWRKALLKSPLIRIVDGKKVVDIQAWFDKINGGKAPDYIVIALGGNRVWIQRPDSRQGEVENELVQARRLVSMLRAAAPETVIAITSGLGGSFDQDSWGKNYGAVQSCFVAHRSFIDYARTMKRFCEEQGDPKLVFVPMSQGLAPLEAYPRGRKSGNAMHANQLGGRQIGDTLFAWLAHDAAERWR